MTLLSISRIAESYRAQLRARATLQPGDRIVVERCGGVRPRYTFTGWDGHWATSASRNDLAPRCIIRLNGAPVSFLDPPWWRGKIDARTGRPYGDHGTHEQATAFALSSDCEDEWTFLNDWTAGNALTWTEYYRKLARAQTLQSIAKWKLG